jgi:hypothetical protein
LSREETKIKEKNATMNSIETKINSQKARRTNNTRRGATRGHTDRVDRNSMGVQSPSI